MEKNKRPTQVERIKKYIEDFGSITTLEAFTELGIVRLGASGEHGHGIVSASEEQVINAVVGKTPQELEREMKAILGGDIKKLG